MERSKVLVVEDHPMSRKMLEAMLRKNYAVISANSGQDAIDLARAEKPDLVLLDIEMPGMDGFQTLEVLKRDVISQAVPVIFLTAREDSQSRDKGLEAGAVDYLTKPYDRQELSIKVKNHLALYEARKEIETRNRIMAREIETASQLQSSILPDKFPESRTIDFAVSYKPFSRAGGDFYDIIELPDQSIGFAQVDVCGHGVASAMIGAMFKMAFQSFARDTPSPAHLLTRINDEMFRVLPDSDFLTVFYGIVDPRSLELVFCNAGHPRPFLYRPGADVMEELSNGGPLVGAFSGMDFDEARVQLSPGDKILVFTDGVTETETPSEPDNFYGEDRLREVFLRDVSLPPSDLLCRILDDLVIFRGKDSFDDDITLLLVSVG